MPLAAEIGLIFGLVLLNGFLALSELAVVSARRSRLQLLASRGHRGAEAALRLAENPGRFLSTVQIGITLVGVAAGAFSGATLADRFGDYLQILFPLLSERWADGVAFALVVTAVTYLSLIVGELVPKQIALRNAERMAMMVAGPMMVMARVAAPAVSLLDFSARLCLKLFGSQQQSAERVTEEEIKTLVAEAESAGVVEPAERAMIAAVMRLGDRTVRSVMTPRADLDWVDLDAPVAKQLDRLRASPYASLPAGHGNIDHAEGVVVAKDVLDAMLDGRQPESLIGFLRVAPVIPDSADVLDALEHLRHAPMGVVLVVDEFGVLQGMISSSDVLQSIVGELASPGGAPQPYFTQREDGSWLVDGVMPRDLLCEAFGLEPPDDEDYDTVAGFALARFGRLPVAGDHVHWRGWRIEVLDMDGRRIDKLLFQRDAVEQPAIMPAK
ncbi:hemolysin family protein [Ferrovibrio sp.]|uniref:hemolysin family protein n=1 Tax=Ferrovibrio sp. TaxID=1917215 RepID=UPI0035B17347